MGDSLVWSGKGRGGSGVTVVKNHYCDNGTAETSVREYVWKQKNENEIHRGGVGQFRQDHTFKPAEAEKGGQGNGHW